MVKYSGGRIISDVFIMPPRPYICPDCHTMHKGECPVQVQKALASRILAIDEFGEALADHAAHINKIIESLASVVKGLEDQEAALVNLHQRVERLEAMVTKRKKRRRASVSGSRGPAGQ